MPLAPSSIRRCARVALSHRLRRFPVQVVRFVSIRFQEVFSRVRKSIRCLLGSMALLLSASPIMAAPPKIGVLLKAKSAFWDAVGAGASEAGSAHHAEVVVKAPRSESDIAVQVQLFNALLARESKRWSSRRTTKTPSPSPPPPQKASRSS